jgi:serine/threonine protein kinase
MGLIPFARARRSRSSEQDPAPATPAARTPKASWGFETGTEIAPGRTVVAPLGGGSAYEVFLVWDDDFCALLVAKVLRPDHAGDPHALRDLVREGEALARLAHPVVVRGFDAALDGPHPHLLIEHLEGPTLHALLHRHGRLPLQQLLPLALHVAGALHCMANRGWVHLDVKPDNIVMGVPPRLLDLSIARPLERAARLSSPVGTDAYMAPEQCDPERFPGAVGPPADIWGLGATLFHAHTGGKPFPRPREARHSPDPVERFPQLVREPEPLPPRTPEPLTEMLTRMLDRDPAARPTAPEFIEALEPLVAGLPRKLVLSKRGARFR